MELAILCIGIHTWEHNYFLSPLEVGRLDPMVLDYFIANYKQNSLDQRVKPYFAFRITDPCPTKDDPDYNRKALRPKSLPLLTSHHELK